MEGYMSKLVAIDGNSIMNRAFYGIMNSKLLMTSDGIYTNAIYGFLSILNKLLQDENPDYICVAFDLKAPTFRHKKYEEYKATRKGMPDELRVQMPIIKDILKAMNIKILELEGYEADDILGTISKYGDENGMDVLLLTGDRDYLQLATNKVTVRIPTTKMGKTDYADYTPEVIYEKFGIEPMQFIEIKGLMGDTSDNIPGVPGVGEKTAFSLIINARALIRLYVLIFGVMVFASILILGSTALLFTFLFSKPKLLIIPVRVIHLSEVTGLSGSSSSEIIRTKCFGSLVKFSLKAFEQGIQPYPGTSNALFIYFRNDTWLQSSTFPTSNGLDIFKS